MRIGRVGDFCARQGGGEGGIYFISALKLLLIYSFVFGAGFRPAYTRLDDSCFDCGKNARARRENC